MKEYRNICWEDDKVVNEYCGDCRLCCGPQGDDALFPMALMPWQINGNNNNDFYMMNADTACLGKQGCKSITDKGCKLPDERRPIACGIFPIVLINGRLYLYKPCPATQDFPIEKFINLAKKAAKKIGRLSPEEQRHLSINLSKAVLEKKYIDLETEIFEPES